MKDGVSIVKGQKTGTSKFKASKSIFQLIKPSKANKSGVYGKYNGEKNISFIGEGKVTIDMNYEKDSIALIMGHNQNVKVENIQFKNMYSGHFIELDASKNVVIRKIRLQIPKHQQTRTKKPLILIHRIKRQQGGVKNGASMIKRQIKI